MEYLNGCKQTGAQHTEPFKTSKLTAKRESLMGAVFYVGDAIEVMNELPEESVDLILSSPPFLALRSYLPSDHPDKGLEGGSQATPGAYIDWLVDVVEACDRVLAPHGSMCIELGDTYAGSGGAGGDYNDGSLREGQPKFKGSTKFARHEGRDEWEAAHPINRVSGTRGSPGGTGWPLAKSLSLIPELFRLTLVYGFNPLTGRQMERWRLRNVIRWVRPNPPVGALGDKFRPATSELMVFCKSAKRFFDLDAVRDSTPRTEHYRNRQNEPSMRRGGQWSTFPDMMTQGGAPPLDWSTGLGARIDSAVRDAWERAKYDQPDLFDSNHGKDQVETVGQKIVREFVAAALLDGGDAVIQPPGGYPGAHYAVWGPVLLPPFIKAMCPEKVCRTCGEPSRRIVENVTAWRRPNEPDARDLGAYLKEYKHQRGYSNTYIGEQLELEATTVAHYFRTDDGARLPGRTEWTQLQRLLKLDDKFDEAMRSVPPDEPPQDYGNRSINGRLSGGPGRNDPLKVQWLGFSDCSYNDWRPGLVLDPFVGSGTTLAVATGHGRNAIGIDLDERNYELALQRVGPFLLELAEM